MSKDKEKLESLTEAASFVKDLREFALTVGEDCPEGHRRDPASGRCLPIGGTDYTAFTRSLNDDQGPEWRGEVVHKEDKQTLASVNTETAVDAEEMDEPESCAEGTTFSFIQRRCVPTEEAEAENSDEIAFEEDELAAAPGEGGHPEIVQMQPEGRRDTVNHDCPPGEFFDFVLRSCIPLDPKKKETRMPGDTTRAAFEGSEIASLATVAGVEFGLPEKQQFPLDTKEKAEQAINAFEQLKKELSPAEQTTLLHNLTIAASRFNIADSFANLPSITATPEWFTQVFKREFKKMVASLEEENKEESAPLGSKRKGLPDSAFGVPAKRKFPLDSCNRVRNAMARFNQSKGLTSGEKATLRRKILARAKACGIEVQSFAAATTEAEFAQVVVDLRREQAVEVRKSVEERYSAKEESGHRGPCPPGMLWDAGQKRCSRTQGFVDKVKANHSEIIMKQPEGRRDTVGHQCPPGQFFDYTRRRCLALNPAQKEGTTTEQAQRDLTPQPKGRPVRLSTDCPKGTIWNKDRNECLPLDSSKKTKSEEEDAAIPPQFLKNLKKKKGKPGDDKDGKKGKNGKDGKKLPPWLMKKGKSEEEEDATSCGDDAPPKKKSAKKPAKKAACSEDEDGQTTPVGPGKELDDHGCDTASETFDIKLGKCVKSRTAKADAIPSNREGLTPPPAGKVQHQSDCPPNTAWDSKMKICRPIDSMDKNRPSGASPESPKSTADEVEELTPARLIQELDRILSEQGENKEKSRVAAKDLPNAAFPPSTVSSTKRVLMHHTPLVEDPYDNVSVDIGRLRNALARASRVEGFSEKAVEDALDHLSYHARAAVTEAIEKKE